MLGGRISLRRLYLGQIAAVSMVSSRGRKSDTDSKPSANRVCLFLRAHGMRAGLVGKCLWPIVLYVPKILIKQFVCILATQPKNRSDPVRHCVLFFDRKDDARRTWAWIANDNLLPFGNLERDREMVLLKDKSKRKNVHEAYKRALANLEEADDDVCI
jgi:hypothetical protein